MNNFIIRKATSDDIDKGLLDLFIEGYKHHQNVRPDIFSITDNNVFKKILVNSLKDDTFMVIVIDGVMIGYLSYQIKTKIFKKLWIDELIITKNYRKKGYGKMLIEKTIDIANDEGCKAIELNCWIFNEDALAMYEHIGFKKQRIVYEMNLD